MAGSCAPAAERTRSSNNSGQQGHYGLCKVRDVPPPAATATAETVGPTSSEFPCSSADQQADQPEPTTWRPVRYLELDVTEDCVLRCSYCFRWNKEPHSIGFADLRAGTGVGNAVEAAELLGSSGS